MATNPSRGLLVTFEGTEGAGKSTLIRELVQRLTALQMDCVATREPGGSQVAEKIRSVILDHSMSPRTELFLYEAARAEHLEVTVLPALRRGAIVLCDRFTDSTLAYQGQARGLPWKEISTLNRIATQGLAPDLTVWLDLDPALGLARASDPNRFEGYGVEFQKKVRLGFARAQRESKRRFLKLNVSKKAPDELAKETEFEILRRFKRPRKKSHGT